MFQCIGLATEQDGGCGEDWWHPECVLGLGRDWLKEAGTGDVDAEGNGESSAPLPPGFPEEEEFEGFICYKCVEANPWIKGYAGTAGFLRPVSKKDPALETDLSENDKIALAQVSGDLAEASSHSNPATTNGEATTLEKVSNSVPSLQSPTTVENVLDSEPSAQLSTNAPSTSKKRKAEDDYLLDPDSPHQDPKKLKTDPPPHHESLHPAPKGAMSIFLHEDFRDHFCRCSSCYPLLRKHPQLLEEEVSYEPPLSQDSQEGGGESVGTGSLLDRGEAALSNVDRVRAIEGVMAYNHLKDKVKSFLQPFAESGTPVGAEDIKAYFEKLRGDDQAIKAASGGAAAVAGRSTDDGGGGGGDGSGGGSGAEGDGRREQSGY